MSNVVAFPRTAPEEIIADCVDDPDATLAEAAGRLAQVVVVGVTHVGSVYVGVSAMSDERLVFLLQQALQAALTGKV